MRRSVTGLLLLSGFMLPLGAQAVARVVAQPQFGPLAPSQRNLKTLVTTQPGEVTASVVTPQGLMESTTIQMEGDNALIVQLRDDPILKFRGTLTGLGPEERKKRLREHHEKLKNAHAQVKAWIRGQEPGKPEGDFKGYAFAFNGLAVPLKLKTLEKLRKHPDVVRVHRDAKVEKCLTESVPLIGAPQIWSSTGADGTGIRVAVIDTGIDYTHPDLGGAFGPGNKVIGGYDFVNLDNDPKDDHGHGTHVAGIIAGDGTVKGVAPGASLLAYKVLSAGGSGYMSDVIAGVDRAVDPDQDPTTNDAVHVISMSLGGGGDPDDPSSQAIDTAVGAGVVCVIAAGNSGSYSTILSPGCARKALTVGASDKSDVIAYFSSRGPNKVDYGIKPDLTGPGVAITSTFLNGGTQTWSGTSMATPHVAGAAALLLQLHPTWTPDEVKGVLSERAKDLGQDAFTQGGGRIQVVPSHQAKAVMTPNSLNFGIDDVDQPIWQKTMIVQFKSLDTVPRAYALAVQGTLPAGISWSLSPANLVLQPGETQTVALTLSVDNGAVPFAPTPTMAYWAKLVATASDDSLAVPVVFYKAGMLTLTFDVEPVVVMIDDQNSDPNDGFSYSWTSYPGLSISVMVPPRNYNVNCWYPYGPKGEYGFSHVVREKVEVTSITSLSISLPNEAVNKIIFKQQDAAGSEIPQSAALEPPGSIFAYYFGYQSGFWGMTVGTNGAPRDTFYFSNISPSYKFELMLPAWYEINGKKIYYEFKYGLKDGIDNGNLILNSPIYKKIKINYQVSPTVDSIWVNFWMGINTLGWASNFSGYVCGQTRMLTRPFELEANLPVLPYPEFTWNQGMHTVHEYIGAPPLCPLATGNNGWNTLLDCGLIAIPDAENFELHHFFQPQVPFYSSNGETLPVGESPYYWKGRLWEWGGPSFALLSAYDGGTPLAISQMGDGAVVNLSYELFQGSTLVQSGIMPSYDFWEPRSLWLSIPTPGAYLLKVPFDAFFVNGQPGHSLASMTFDTSNTHDKLPPYLNRLSILKNGQISSITDANSQNQLSLQVEDNVALSEVGVSYQTPGEDWQPLPLSLPSGTAASYLDSLPTGLPQGPVNLKVVAKDVEGNTLTNELNPAYFHFNTGPDIEPPMATASEAGSRATITLSATASDNVGVTQVDFYVDDILKGSDSTAPYSMTLDSTTLSNGSHSLVAKATDAAGNVGVSPGVPFTIDNQAPTATASETGARATIALSATASDNIGVTQVEFFVDDILKGTDSTAPYSMTLDSTTLSNGSHALVAKAYDAAGNVGTSPSVPFAIDNQAPAVTAFESGSTGTITLSATASDNVSVTQVEFYLDGALKGTDTTAPYAIPWATVYADNGTHALVAKAYDAAGNVGDSASLPFTVNNPAIFYEREPNETLAAANVVVSPFQQILAAVGTATDLDFFRVSVPAGGTLLVTLAGPVQNCNLHLYNGSGAVVKAVTGSTSTKSITTTNTTGSPASYFIRVKGYNGLFDPNNPYTIHWSASGGTGGPTDTTAPTVSASESGSSGTITLSATASDSVGVTRVEFFVDGLLKGSDETAPYAITWTTGSADNGSHALVAKAHDATGNVGTSTSVPFTISNPVSDTSTEQEPNNSLTAANGVATTTSQIGGTVSTATDRDYFKVTVGAGRILKVTMTGPAALCNLKIYSATGAQLASATGSSTPKVVSTTNTTASIAIYYLRVSAYIGLFDPASPYALALSR